LEIIANLPYCKAEQIHLAVNFLINASQKDFCYCRIQMWIFSYCPFVMYIRPPYGVKAQGLLYLLQYSSARQLHDYDKIKIETTQYNEQILRSVSYQKTSILLGAAEFTFSLVRKLNSFFYSIYLTFLVIIRFYPWSILDDGVNKIFVLRAQMCDALEVAPLVLFAPP